jgi:ABC-2 type transport system ATP-binding protein
MSIEVRGLSKLYGEQKAVNDISFSLAKGEIVGFLGPNGAGKSTTMKIVTGYLRQTTGDAFVCGLNVKENPLAVKKKIGYLPEANPLYYDMYVREYLEFIASVHGVAHRREAVASIIQMVGLTPEAKKKIGQLSKGYRQRVGLAAALIHRPEVLVLDEPTSGLDPNQIVEIRELIRREGSDKTVLFSTHILQEVEAICDRVIIIDKGRIVADDKLVKLQAGNKHMVIVAFQQPVDLVILTQIRSVTSVDHLQGATYQLHTEDPGAVKKQILETALQNNLNIVSLQSENQSLEEVFRSLTQKS